jgi:hypothetical protein
MFQLNIKAVDARYGMGEAVKFRKLDYHFEHTEAVLTFSPKTVPVVVRVSGNMRK